MHDLSNLTEIVTYCIKCLDYVECKIENTKRDIRINGEIYTLEGKLVRCPVCGEYIEDQYIGEHNIRQQQLFLNRLGIDNIKDVSYEIL